MLSDTTKGQLFCVLSAQIVIGRYSICTAGYIIQEKSPRDVRPTACVGLDLDTEESDWLLMDSPAYRSAFPMAVDADDSFGDPDMANIPSRTARAPI